MILLRRTLEVGELRPLPLARKLQEGNDAVRGEKFTC